MPKISQNMATHADSVEDSLVVSLKDFEFEKDHLSQILTDRKYHAFKPEYDAASV